MLEGMEIMDVIALLALSLVVVSLALVWAIRTAWGLMCNLRDEEVEHAHTRRRLADVEAIRARDAASNAASLANAKEMVRRADPISYSTFAHDDDTTCIDCGTTGWGSDHDEDCRNNPARHFDPEEVSELPVAIRGPVPNSTKASHRPAHGGYPDPIKARDIARSTDRAYADAGIMPVADYVAKHGREPRW